MSRASSLRQRLRIGLLYVMIVLSGWSIASARKMLLFAENLGGLYYCLELQTTGQLVWTGTILTTGNNNTEGFAVSPDQHYLWVQYSNLPSSEGIMQYGVSPYGQITATGKSVQLSVPPYDLMFTPNGKLLILGGGTIFRVNPDSSIQDTGNVSNYDLNISPRGDIIYSQTSYTFPDYPEQFQIAKIDYTSAVITTLEVITTIGQPQYQAVYRPAGDYIAFPYIGGPLEVRHVLSNGTLDTTQVWDYTHGGGIYLDITPDGNHIYANGISHLNWSSQSSMFVDSEEINPVSNLYQIKVSPDGQFLVVDYQDFSIDGGADFLKTFLIQYDGSLIDTGYTFPFTENFGDYTADVSRLIFVWTPQPTSVPYELWKEFDDK